MWYNPGRAHLNRRKRSKLLSHVLCDSVEDSMWPMVHKEHPAAFPRVFYCVGILWGRTIQPLLFVVLANSRSAIPANYKHRAFSVCLVHGGAFLFSRRLTNHKTALRANRNRGFFLSRFSALRPLLSEGELHAVYLAALTHPHPQSFVIQLRPFTRNSKVRGSLV